MPLLSMGRSFLKKIKYRVSIPVSAYGRSFCAVKPLDLAYSDVNSTVSPFCKITLDTYDPNSTVNSLPDAANMFDLGILGINGTGIGVDEFDVSSIISFHACINLTGVSQLNKKGQIYIAEDRSNFYAKAMNPTGNGAIASTYCNKYPLSSLAKLYHSKRVEIANMDSSSALEYHWIPAQSYANTQAFRPHSLTSNATGQGTNEKHLIVIVEGADPTTILSWNIEIVLQMEPNVSYLNNYPVEPTTCLLNPDPELRLLEQDKNVVIRTNNKEGHISDGIVMSSLLNNYSSSVIGGRSAIAKAMMVTS